MLQSLVGGHQDMFRRQALASQEDHQERHRFESELKAMLDPVPPSAQSNDTPPSASNTRFPSARTRSQQPPIGQYYAVPSQTQSFHTAPQRSTPHNYMVHNSPFLAPPTKFTHCSNFKTYLDPDGVLLSDSLTLLEIFVDGIKGALDTATSAHYSFAPYAEWNDEYLLTTALCPPKLAGHFHYKTMYIKYNDYGQMVYRYMHSTCTVNVTSRPRDFNELTALDIIKCGWKLLQEGIWAYSPQMNGPYRDSCFQLWELLPFVNEMIVTFYHRVQELAHEITLSCDTTGIQHELLHHFIKTFCNNGDYGFTRNMLW
jgi:hypothetical protein